MTKKLWDTSMDMNLHQSSSLQIKGFGPFRSSGVLMLVLSPILELIMSQDAASPCPLIEVTLCITDRATFELFRLTIQSSPKSTAQLLAQAAPLSFMHFLSDPVLLSHLAARHYRSSVYLYCSHSVNHVLLVESIETFLDFVIYLMEQHILCRENDLFISL